MSSRTRVGREPPEPDGDRGLTAEPPRPCPQDRRGVVRPRRHEPAILGDVVRRRPLVDPEVAVEHANRRRELEPRLAAVQRCWSMTNPGRNILRRCSSARRAGSDIQVHSGSDCRDFPWDRRLGGVRAHDAIERPLRKGVCTVSDAARAGSRCRAYHQRRGGSRCGPGETRAARGRRHGLGAVPRRGQSLLRLSSRHGGRSHRLGSESAHAHSSAHPQQTRGSSCAARGRGRRNAPVPGLQL